MRRLFLVIFKTLLYVTCIEAWSTESLVVNSSTVPSGLSAVESSQTHLITTVYSTRWVNAQGQAQQTTQTAFASTEEMATPKQLVTSTSSMVLSVLPTSYSTPSSIIAYSNHSNQLVTPTSSRVLSILPNSYSTPPSIIVYSTNSKQLVTPTSSRVLSILLTLNSTPSSIIAYSNHSNQLVTPTSSMVLSVLPTSYSTPSSIIAYSNHSNQLVTPTSSMVLSVLPNSYSTPPSIIVYSTNSKQLVTPTSSRVLSVLLKLNSTTSSIISSRHEQELINHTSQVDSSPALNTTTMSIHHNVLRHGISNVSSVLLSVSSTFISKCVYFIN